MPKYYVQSGLFRGVVVRRNAKEAARWAVEFVMNKPKGNQTQQLDSDVGLFRLGKFISTSERGFSREDRLTTPTAEAVLDWMIAAATDAQPRP